MLWLPLDMKKEKYKLSYNKRLGHRYTIKI